LTTTLYLHNMTPQRGTLHVPMVIKRRRQTRHQHACSGGRADRRVD